LVAVHDYLENGVWENVGKSFSVEQLCLQQKPLYHPSLIVCFEKRGKIMDETIAKLVAYIAKDILKQPSRVIKPDELIISSGLIDSFSLVDLSLFIEDNFKVRIDDTELNAETFDTLEQLAALIHSRQ
jgi:acyl carrier protein